MIDGLKPYPAMKDSGVPWLGEVPEHWGIHRLGALMRERGETNDDGRVTDVLSVMRERGVIPYAEKGNVGNKKSDDTTRYKVVRPDDIVVNCMNVIIGSVGISRYTGCLSPVYYVLTRRNANDSPQYLNAYFQAKSFQRSLVRIGNGILAHRMRIPMELLKCEMFPHPPIQEQSTIVRFLDHANQRIRRYIRAKQKLIKLLEEQKQAIIHRAVTRGLDPNVRLKPSGVEWLGDVPEHWDVHKLRYVIRGKLTYGANAAAEYTNPEWPRYLRITDFDVDGTLREGTFRSLPPEIAKDYFVQPGDILLARSGATVGKAFLVPEGSGLSCYAGYLIRARPNRAVIDPEFLFVFTQSPAFARWKDSTFIIATIQNIGADKYADLPVPMPPLHEQSAIIRFLKEETTSIVSAIDRAQHEISLLREYRTRMIVDVVTGKLDVRVVAASLPYEDDEQKVLDETDLLSEDDEDAAESNPDAAPEEAEA